MARGGLAIRTIILSILLTVSLASALEPVYIGGGRDGSVINLDSGARREGVVPHFGAAGFAAPRSPQPMEVDPGAMVYQSKGYRDATKDLYLKSADILNRTALLADDVEESWRMVDQSAKKTAELQAMAKVSADRSNASANDSLKSAMSSRNCLVETSALHNQTLDTAKRMDALAERMYKLENQTRDDAERSAESARLAKDCLSEAQAIGYMLNSISMDSDD